MIAVKSVAFHADLPRRLWEDTREEADKSMATWEVTSQLTF